MPLIIAALLIIFSVLIILKLRGKKNCRWIPTHKSTGVLQEFKCKTCGFVAYSREKYGPTECKRQFDKPN